MNIVLTMAGKYNRFKLFGNKVPKYLLPLGSGTMLKEVIKQLKLSSPESRMYLIANRNDQIFFPIVRSIMDHFCIHRDAIIYIDDTSSQLETALFATELLTGSEQAGPICFANIDTVLFHRSSFFERCGDLESKHGLIDTFVGDSNQYSFVRLGEDGRVVDVVDKNVISDRACSGLYGFGSFSQMKHIASNLLAREGGANFTRLYQELISLGLQVDSSHSQKTNETIVLGTPEEYLINIHRFR